MHTPGQPYPKPERGIALVGFMGSGKSTIGPLLAQRTARSFVDLDALLTREHGPVGALVAHDERRFRELEREALARVPDGCVLATGGGTYIEPSTRAEIERRFDTVWLQVDQPTVTARLGGAEPGRPLLGRPGLFEARQAVYAAARVAVDASPPPPDVLRAVMQALAAPSERVQDYLVHFTSEPARALDGLVDPVVIADARVWDLHGDQLGAVSRAYTFPPEQKTIATWVELVDRILAGGLHRSQTVVALGGGVTGDLAGFCAATLLRGLSWRSIPTTTLAMVDSSVGAKTGLDHARGKNLIGAFHRPSGVWVDVTLLETLPERDRAAGLAEAVKTGLVHDPTLFELFEHATIDAALLEHVIRLSIRAKGAIVAADELEAGPRRVLNAGHTVGHALEAALGLGTLRHGEAVAIGLVAETAFAEEREIAPPGTTERVRTALDRLGLPTAPPRFDRRAALAAMQLDKKVSRDTLELPLVVSPGRTRRYDLPIERLNELLPT